MRKFRKILYVVYFVFHLVLVVSILYVQDQFAALFADFSFVLYIAVFGLVLFFVDLAFDLLIVKNYESKIQSLEGEKNEVKAKLYDKAETTITPTEQDDKEEQV